MEGRRLEMSELRHLHVEIPTGGKPLEKVMEAFLSLPNEGRAWVVDINHDDGCPTMKSDVIEDCTCEILLLVAHTLKRPVFKTDKVPPEWQAVESTGGALGWKPPLLAGRGDVPIAVTEYWHAVFDNVRARLPDWERDYWARRLGIGSDITQGSS